MFGFTRILEVRPRAPSLALGSPSCFTQGEDLCSAWTPGAAGPQVPWCRGSSRFDRIGLWVPTLCQIRTLLASRLAPDRGGPFGWQP